MSLNKRNNRNFDESWRSYNAQKCIDNYEFPIPFITKKNMGNFLSAYQKAYPAKVNEYIFLSKIKIHDWKFCAKHYRCTSWHHFGPTAQRTGFWDMWALADEILLKCRTSSGDYRYQLMTDYIASTRAVARQNANDLYSQNKVRLCIVKFMGASGLIHAPCLVWVRWGKTHKQDILYFDYVEIHDYCECDTPTFLNPEEVSLLPEFAIINTFKKYDDYILARFSTFHKSSFYKLINYAKDNNLIISTMEQDNRPKLEYKGPPKP